MKRLAAALLLIAAGAMADGAALPPDSLYLLRVSLTTQADAAAGLDRYRGQPVLISMFYGSCPAACPMLITAMQVYESHLDPERRGRLRVLLVSFDAARDTPVRLSAVAALHRADPARWTFASASDNDARKIAALLGISYRRQPDGNYDHSLLITLLDAEGRVIATTTKLVGDRDFQRRLEAATAAP